MDLSMVVSLLGGLVHLQTAPAFTISISMTDIIAYANTFIAALMPIALPVIGVGLASRVFSVIRRG